MALCFKCHKPVFPFPTCEEHAEEWLVLCEDLEAKTSRELEEAEAKLAAQYFLAMPCREALIERWRAGELRQDDILKRWRAAHFEYVLVHCKDST